MKYKYTGTGVLIVRDKLGGQYSVSEVNPIFETRAELKYTYDNVEQLEEKKHKTKKGDE